jgi:thymidine kinase
MGKSRQQKSVFFAPAHFSIHIFLVKRRLMRHRIGLCDRLVKSGAPFREVARRPKGAKALREWIMAKLYFNYSTMNAGKSTMLLQASYNYQERGMRTLIFTAAFDDRAGVGRVASRIGLSSDALTFDENTDLFAEVSALHVQAPVACVFVDEANFLSEHHVWQLAEIVDRLDIPVMTYGLRTDFQGKLFPASKELLAIADELREIRTICHCGRKATMVARFDNAGNVVTEGAQIEVGGNEKYVSFCRRHWVEAFNGG